jgi:Uma2 family endonuclease
MDTTTGELILAQFLLLYTDSVKPYFEFWEGKAIQKATSTKLHAILQKLVADMLEECGFQAYPELGLRIDPRWQPVPDVAATAEPFKGPYPTAPVDVVVEILSAQDAFVQVESKCERYATLRIPDVLVFDPAEERAWFWDEGTRSLLHAIQPVYRFHSRPFTLNFPELWNRFRKKRSA